MKKDKEAPTQLEPKLKSLGAITSLRRVTALFALVGSVLLTAPTASAQLMSVAGTHEVTSSGAFSYSIPIEVSPGLAGIAPSLKLRYNSQGGNGPIGVGWSLEGLSSITRCAQSSFEDGQNWIGGIRYSGSDRFCLDGQRLVAMADPALPNSSVGVYGADGTYYSTLQESFSKIRSVGVQGGGANPYGQPYAGPVMFIVKTRSGLTMEFGGTSDSRASAGNGMPIRSWLLSKVMDSSGNYMSVTYRNDATNLQAYPIQISYTGNDTAPQKLSPSISVVFEYEARPDPIIDFQSVVKSTLTVRLVKVKAAYEYRLGYVDTSNSYFKKWSHLNNVTVCSRNGSQCKPPLTFDYSLDVSPSDLVTGSFVPAESTTVCAGGSSAHGGCNDSDNYRFFFPDYNGDGRSDICFRSDAGIRCYSSNGASFDWNNPVITDICSGLNKAGYGGCDDDSKNFATIQFLDFNGDGRSDLFFRSNQGLRIFYSTGNGFVFAEGYDMCGNMDPLCNDSENFRFSFPDINADGRPDFCFRHDSKGVVCHLRKISGLDMDNAIVPGVCANGSMAGGVCNDNDNFMTIQFVDLNGDGRADLFYRSDSGIRVWLSVGTAFVPSEEYALCKNGDAPGILAGCSTSGNREFSLADINGDGYPDLCHRALEGVRCFYRGPFGFDMTAPLLTANCSSTQVFDLCNSIDNFSTIQFIDINADGRADLFFRADLGITVNFSNGIRFMPEFASPVCANNSSEYGVCNDSDNYSFYFPDINGDGIPDLVYRGDTGLQIRLGSWQRPVITGVRDGLSNSVAIGVVYKSLPSILGARYLKDDALTVPGQRAAVVLPSVKVVTDVDSRTGVNGATRRLSYSYGTAMAEMGTGRGLLGFKWLQILDGSTGLSSRSVFRLDWPYMGLVEQAGQGTSASNWSNLSLTTNSYGCFALPGGPATTCAEAPGQRYFVYQTTGATRGWDLNGTLLPETRVLNSNVDAFGNIGAVTTTVVDPAGESLNSKVATSVYYNDPVNWYLGRLIKTSVTATDADVLPPLVPGSGNLAPAPSPQLPAVLLMPILQLLLEDD